MKVMLLCGNRYAAREALKILLAKKVWVVGCVFEESRPNQLSELCDQNNIPCYTNSQMYEALEAGELPHFDLGISYLYHRLIKPSLIEFANDTIINFHPAPIQVHRGVAACCYCLLKEYKEWAVTAHYIAAGIDEGDIIMERKFSIEGIQNGVEAENYIQKQSLQLFQDVITLFLDDVEIPRKKQDLSRGCYFGRKELEQEKIINITDDVQMIDKKIRSLWLPPYHGASIEIGGKRYTLVNEELLQEIAELYEKIYRIQDIKNEEG